MADTLRSCKNTSLSPSVQKLLNSYVLAASAAGVGALALAQPAKAEVVYTPTHFQLRGDLPFPLDLTHNGKATLFLMERGFDETGGNEYVQVCHKPWLNTGTGVWNCLSTTLATNQLNQVKVTTSGVAAALGKGISIQKGDRFGGKKGNTVRMGSVFYATNSPGKTTWRNPWVDGGKGVKDRYLGIKFLIDGQFHFGWARLTVATTQHNFTTTITGYAYETVPGQAILTGETSGPDVITLPPGAKAGTLGSLAAGRRR
jgi:hypothetical protein